MLLKITKPVDDILNKITMYRLVLYVLIAYWIYALALSFFHFLPFTPITFLITSTIILTTCWITNFLLAKIFNVVTNLESVYISTFILIFIITPAITISNYIFLIFACIFAIASKYILVINKEHIFNPVAVAVVITAILSIGSASWWIGSANMLPLVLLLGLLLLRKIQKEDLVISFLVSSVFVISLFTFLNRFDVLSTIYKLVLDTPILFFALIMLTEPQTMPPIRNLRIYYGVLIGILFSSQIHIGNFYITPEISLVIGNIFSFIVSPREKLILTLKEKIKLAPDIYDFIFGWNKKSYFNPGQYLEWTLGYNNPDSRGNRRYFTIASSPSEDTIKIGVKFYPNSSGFKKKLLSLPRGDKILAGNLSGDFTMPKDENKKLVFIAGGIGITPFRSMIKYLLDKNEKRNIVIFYSNKKEEDIVYKDILDQGLEELGIKTIYNLTEIENVSKSWKGKIGRLDSQMITKEVPDYKERVFYLSGPHAMVKGFEDVLNTIGISKDKVKKDFFPGYA